MGLPTQAGDVLLPGAGPPAGLRRAIDCRPDDADACARRLQDVLGSVSLGWPRPAARRLQGAEGAAQEHFLTDLS